jgi:hypothetical protein
MASRVSGANAKIAIKPEATFKTAPSGNWVYVPFMECDLAPNDQVSDDAVLGLGRQAQRPARDLVEYRGRITVPVDAEAIGWWLYGLLGAATVSGSGPYTHVWTSALGTLPSFGLEIQHPDGASAMYETYTGVMLDGFSVEFAATGRPRLSIDLVACASVLDGTSAAGTPTTPALTWFHQKVNSLKKDTVALAKVPSFSLTYANNLELDRYVGGAGEVDAVVPGLASARGQIQARFNAPTLHDLAVAGTVFDLEAGWSNSASQKLLFELDQAELLRRGRALNGPGGISQSYEVYGSQDPSEGAMLRATLINATSAYS